jgi:hypothetical protein
MPTVHECVLLEILVTPQHSVLAQDSFQLVRIFHTLITEVKHAVCESPY